MEWKPPETVSPNKELSLPSELIISGVSPSRCVGSLWHPGLFSCGDFFRSLLSVEWTVGAWQPGSEAGPWLCQLPSRTDFLLFLRA